MRTIKFFEEHLNMIYEDQRSMLECHHKGKACAALQKCPENHFDDCLTDVKDRQEIMETILEDANQT